MATHKSALKRHRQSLKRRAHNRVIRGTVRRAVKRVRTLVASGDASSAAESLPETASRLDRAVKKGVMHKNTAARQKSRLAKLLNNAAK